MESSLQDVATELADAEGKLKAKIEKLFGKIETTDFSAEYAELQDVHAKISALANPSPSASAPETSQAV